MLRFSLSNHTGGYYILGGNNAYINLFFGDNFPAALFLALFGISSRFFLLDTGSSFLSD